MELNYKKVKITEHAYKRASDRLGLTNRNHATGQIRSILKNAQRIGLIVSEDGNESILYALNRIAIYLSTDLQRVITVNRFENITYVPVKQKVKEIHEKELRKLDKVISSKTKYTKIIKAELGIEIANLSYRLIKTRSQSVKMACEARIKAIREYIKQLDDEVSQVQNAKRQLARSMVSVI